MSFRNLIGALLFQISGSFKKAAKNFWRKRSEDDNQKFSFNQIKLSFVFTVAPKKVWCFTFYERIKVHCCNFISLQQRASFLSPYFTFWSFLLTLSRMILSPLMLTLSTFCQLFMNTTSSRHQTLPLNKWYIPFELHRKSQK